MKNHTLKFLTLAIIAAATFAQAAAWLNTAQTPYWNDAANWNGGVPVGAAADINVGATLQNPVIITNGVVATPSAVNIAWPVGSATALLIEAGGELSASGGTMIGRQGTGVIINNGGKVYLRRLDIGGDANNGNPSPSGSGSFYHMAGELVICTNNPASADLFYFGIGGNAYFKAEADFSVLLATRFGMRDYVHEKAIMELGAISAKFNGITMGFSQDTDAQIIMRGTQLEISPPSTGDPNLVIRRLPTSTAVIRGWGKIFGGRLVNNGKVIADGEGTARDLDVTYYYHTSTINAPSMTDCGWYAVNKGRMVFQELPVASSNGNTIYFVGFRSAGAVWSSHNSAQVTLNRNDEGVIKPHLLAADHPSVPPMGYPLKNIKSVWNFETPTFNNATVVFRYDETAVSDPALLRIMRYDPAANGWRRIPASHDDTNHRFTASALAPWGTDNLGMFSPSSKCHSPSS